jgi:hypothetical protein
MLLHAFLGDVIGCVPYWEWPEIANLRVVGAKRQRESWVNTIDSQMTTWTMA